MMRKKKYKRFLTRLIKIEILFLVSGPGFSSAYVLAEGLEGTDAPDYKVAEISGGKVSLPTNQESSEQAKVLETEANFFSQQSEKTITEINEQQEAGTALEENQNEKLLDVRIEQPQIHRNDASTTFSKPASANLANRLLEEDLVYIPDVNLKKLFIFEIKAAGKYPELFQQEILNADFLNLTQEEIECQPVTYEMLASLTHLTCQLKKEKTNATKAYEIGQYVDLKQVVLDYNRTPTANQGLGDISNLNGLQYAFNLQELVLQGHTFGEDATNLQYIPSNLTRLSLKENKIASLELLPINMPKLKILELGNDAPTITIGEDKGRSKPWPAVPDDLAKDFDEGKITPQTNALAYKFYYHSVVNYRIAEGYNNRIQDISSLVDYASLSQLDLNGNFISDFYCLKPLIAGNRNLTINLDKQLVKLDETVFEGATFYMDGATDLYNAGFRSETTKGWGLLSQYGVYHAGGGTSSKFSEIYHDEVLADRFFPAVTFDASQMGKHIDEMTDDEYEAFFKQVGNHMAHGFLTNGWGNHAKVTYGVAVVMSGIRGVRNPVEPIISIVPNPATVEADGTEKAVDWTIKIAYPAKNKNGRENELKEPVVRLSSKSPKISLDLTEISDLNFVENGGVFEARAVVPSTLNAAIQRGDVVDLTATLVSKNSKNVAATGYVAVTDKDHGQNYALTYPKEFNFEPLKLQEIENNQNSKSLSSKLVAADYLETTQKNGFNTALADGSQAAAKVKWDLSVYMTEYQVLTDMTKQELKEKYPKYPKAVRRFAAKVTLPKPTYYYRKHGDLSNRESLLNPQAPAVNNMGDLQRSRFVIPVGPDQAKKILSRKGATQNYDWRLNFDFEDIKFTLPLETQVYPEEYGATITWNYTIHP